MRRASLLVLLWVGLAGCVRREAFQCSEAADCVLDGANGECTAEGFCAYPETDCPSQWAYSPNAGDGLANACVPADDAETSTGSPDDTDTDAPMPAVCTDGMVDATEDCDDGNDLEEDGCASDCRRSGEVEWLVRDENARTGTSWNAVVAVETPDGTPHVHVAGRRDGTAVVVALSGEDGQELWVAPLDGNDATGLSISPSSGNLYVALDESEAGVAGARCLNTSGSACSNDHYDVTEAAGGDGRDAAFRLDAQSDGQVVLASRHGVSVFRSGVTDPDPPTYDASQLTKLDALTVFEGGVFAGGSLDDGHPAVFTLAPDEARPSLSRLWRGDEPGQAQDVVAADGHLFVGGWQGNNARIGFLAQLEFDGTLTWSAPLPCEGDCEVEALVVEGETLYAAGFSIVGTKVATVWAYDTQGNARWSRAYPELEPPALIRSIDRLDGLLYVSGELAAGDGQDAFVARIRP